MKLVEAFEKTLKWIQLLVGQIYQPVQGGVFNPPKHGCPVYTEQEYGGLAKALWGQQAMPSLKTEKEHRRWGRN